MDKISLFRERLLAVSGEFIASNETQDLLSLIAGFIKSNSIKSVVVSDFPQRGELRDILPNDVEILADFGERTYAKEEAKQLCASAEAGITGIYAIIADTGTLVIASRHRGDRLCSSLPPIHLALIDNARVYENFAEFIADTPKDYTYALITGPSRTADIEKKLILGAHGPKRVAVFSSVA